MHTVGSRAPSGTMTFSVPEAAVQKSPEKKVKALFGSTRNEQRSLPDPKSRSLWETGAWSGLAALTLTASWRS